MKMERTNYQAKDYLKIPVVRISNKGVKYIDHLRPLDLKKTAMMDFKMIDFKHRAFEPEEREPGMEG